MVIDVIQIALPYSNKDGIAKRAWTFVEVWMERYSNSIERRL